MAPRAALAAAFDLEGAFNDLSIAALHGASLAAIIADLDHVLAPYGSIGAYDRDDHPSAAYLAGELDELRVLASVVPPIFLGVASFLLYVVVARLVTIEREQIGLLKAFGYSNGAVGWHYLKFVLVIVALGLLLGFALGGWLGHALTEMYARFFRFPFLTYGMRPWVFVLAAVVTLAAATAATLGTVRRAARLPPAVAMQPAAPTIYRRLVLDRLGLGRVLHQPTRMILRHLVRWPVRNGFKVTGMALASGILVVALATYDEIEALIEIFFHRAQRQEVTVSFVEPRESRVADALRGLPGVMAVEPFRLIATRLRAGHRLERVAIAGLEPEGDLHRLLDDSMRPLELPEFGLVLSRKLAEMLGVHRGEAVIDEALEGRRPQLTLPVTAIVMEYISTPAYMHRAALNRAAGEGDLISGAYLAVDPRRGEELYHRLKDAPVVASALRRSAALETLRVTLAESMNIVLGFYVALGGLIAVGVVYNTARIALSERGRELASLRVLGFSQLEVSYILLGELAILLAFALPIGCALGYGAAALVAQAADSHLVRIPLVVEPATLGLAALVVVLATVASGAIICYRLAHLDLVAMFKTRE